VNAPYATAEELAALPLPALLDGLAKAWRAFGHDSATARGYYDALAARLGALETHLPAVESRLARLDGLDGLVMSLDSIVRNLHRRLTELEAEAGKP